MRLSRTIDKALVIMLVFPLISVIYNSLRKGFGFYFEAISTKYVLSALGVTVFAAVIAVVVNTVFGLFASWLLTRYSFKGKQVLATLIDIPFSVSPVVAGLAYIMTFGRLGWASGIVDAVNNALGTDIKIVFALPGVVLATIFALEGEAWEICRYAIRCYCLILPFYAFDFIVINYYQTIQRKLLAAILSILQGLVLVVSSVFVLSKISDGSNLWFGFIISEAVTFAAVWILSKIYANKHDLSGLLLERKCDCTRNIEMTLSNNLQDAENVSQKIQDFCLENEVDSARALQVGICAEELITNVINYGYNKDVLQYIDVNVRIIENEVILRVRDDGITFNPVEYHTEEMSFSGIETVKKLAKSLNYSRVLGFNSSIIKV